MKKLIAIALVLTLVLSMGALAFAVEEGPSKVYVDSSNVTIDKNLTITNEGTVNPGEEFKFTVGDGVPTAPATAADVKEIDDFTITIAKDGTTGTANINLPEFTQVGVYTYPIEEVKGNTAGMSYDGAKYFLAITVINNPNFGEEGQPKFLRVLTLADQNGIKNDAFKNEYSAGNLTVKKVIAGNYSDPDDEFEITVTITPDEGKTINAEAIEWGGATFSDSAGVYTATKKLKGGENFTIQNLPYDVTYVVEETNSGVGYTATYENESGKFDKATITTTITNTRNTNIETGINLDNLPYVLILVGAAAGLVAFTMKRRPSSDE